MFFGLLLLDYRCWAQGRGALPFDERSAMKTLFASWDEASDSARSAVPNDHAADLSDREFKPGDPLVVRPFWSHIYWTEGKRTAVILTYAVPFDPTWIPIVPGEEPFSCHACTPLLGVAVFLWSGSEWKAEASRLAVSRVGAWGRPPSPIQLMKIGRNRMAVRINDDYEGGGTTTRVIQIISLDGGISNALRITLGEDNSGGCERHQPSDEPVCYQYKKTLTLKAGSNADFYDIWTVLRGTDYNDDQSRGVHQVSGREVFRFTNGAYERILPLP